MCDLKEVLGYSASELSKQVAEDNHQDKEAASQISRTHNLVQCLVEWLVRLEEERKADLPPVFCRCSKAVNINQELKTVGRGLGDVSKLGERLGAEAAAPHLDSVSQDLVRLAGLLRADVSILIPSSIGRAEPSVAEQAREIVAEAESVSGLVQETVEGVTKLVYSLLGVDTCQHCSGGLHCVTMRGIFFILLFHL